MPSEALILIDVQNDFCEGGALAVPEASAILPRLLGLAEAASAVILTQDWHPEGHSSFASQHPGHAPYDVVEMPYGPQVLWPDHCVQGSLGAAFHPGLPEARADLVIRKGFRRDVDSYSAFFENDRRTPTGLEGYLRTRGIGTVTLAGLALDFCVAFSAIDAARLGFSVTVAEGACRAIDTQGSRAAALTGMAEAGVRLTD